MAGITGLKSPAIVKDANTIETTLDTATPVVTFKTWPDLVSSNFYHLLPALVSKPDTFVIKLEFIMFCHQDGGNLSASSSIIFGREG